MPAARSARRSPPGTRNSATPRKLRNADAMNGAYLGPAFAQDEIEAALTAAGATFETVSDDDMIADYRRRPR